MAKRDSKEENDAQGLMYRIGIGAAAICLMAATLFSSMYMASQYGPGAAFTAVVLSVIAVLYLCNLAWTAVDFVVRWD